MYKLSIAVRYLLKRRIAYISIVAIAFGVMAMIVVMGVMEGFQRRIRSSIFKVDASLSVSLQAKSLRDRPDHYDRVMTMLEPFMVDAGGEVIAGARRMTYPVLIQTRAPKLRLQPGVTRSEIITLVGVRPDEERRVTPLDEMLDAVKPSYMQVPNFPEARENPFLPTAPGNGPPPAEPGIVLGIKLAERLVAGPGDLISVVTGRIDDVSFDKDIEPVTHRFRVTGCFQSGRFEYDRNLAFCDVEELRTFLRIPSDCETVHLRLRDPDRAREVKDAIVARYGRGPEGLHVLTWEEQMRSYVEALQFEKLAMMIVLACIIAVAGACICGILYMVVLEKTRDIGILLALGATSPGIVGIFLLYGGVLGLIGTVLGLILGLEVSWNLDAIIRFVEVLIHRDLFPPDVYEFQSLPVYLDSDAVLWCAVATFGWCLLSSVLPALKASRLDPLKCLSYE